MPSCPSIADGRQRPRARLRAAGVRGAGERERAGRDAAGAPQGERRRRGQERRRHPQGHRRQRGGEVQDRPPERRPLRGKVRKVLLAGDAGGLAAWLLWQLDIDPPTQLLDYLLVQGVTGEQ